MVESECGRRTNAKINDVSKKDKIRLIKKTEKNEGD